MEITALFAKLIPLYLIVSIGYLSAKFYQIEAKTLSRLLIYVISPIVVFFGVATVELDIGLILLPVICFGLCGTVALAFWGIGNSMWLNSKLSNIVGFTAGTGNTGYFGLPLIITLLGSDKVGIAIMAGLGFILYENTLGFFIAANGKFNARTSLSKILRLPTIYAFMLGLFLNFYPIPLPMNLFDAFKGSYTILGMMIIGISLASLRKLELDLNLIKICFGAKFLVWPLMVFALGYIDKSTTMLFRPDVLEVLQILSIVPMAANTVALANEFDLCPESVSLVVSLSTIMPIILLPILEVFFKSLG